MWCEQVQALVEGRSAKRKLLIIAPPGHAKSTWISLIMPAWYLSNHADHSILFFTSNDPMAVQFSTTIKATLETSKRHRIAFPGGDCRPDPGRGWSTDGLYLQGTPVGSKDPAYRAVGYGASVIGGRAHGVILDDPLTQEEAQSLTVVDKAKQYHDMTVDSRLHPTGWELAIMTRWAEFDLGAYFAGKTKEWDVLHLPALGYWGEGEALWPERFPLAWLEAKRNDVGGPIFNCLYQGDPTGLGGPVFRSASWFRPLPPKLDLAGMTVVQFWDLAFSEKASADYTAAVTLGVDAERNLYVLRVLRKRLSPVELEAAMVEQIETAAPNLVGIEEGAFRQAATRDLMRRLQRRVLAPVMAVKPSTDKVTRALLPAARAEAGMLFVDRAAPWFPEFEAECLGFPLALHDDQVDALAGAAQLALEHAGAAGQPRHVSYGWQPPEGERARPAIMGPGVDPRTNPVDPRRSGIAWRPAGGETAQDAYRRLVREAKEKAAAGAAVGDAVGDVE